MFHVLQSKSLKNVKGEMLPLWWRRLPFYLKIAKETFCPLYLVFRGFHPSGKGIFELVEFNVKVKL